MKGTERPQLTCSFNYPDTRVVRGHDTVVRHPGRVIGKRVSTARASWLATQKERTRK